MNLIQYPLAEKIGEPNLFVGREHPERGLHTSLGQRPRID